MEIQKLEALASSKARLTDPATLKRFVEVVGYFAGLRIAGEAARPTDQLAWTSLVPLVFGLLPRAALVDRERFLRPQIAQHLSSVGISEPGPGLTDLLFFIASHMRSVLEGKEKLGLAEMFRRGHYDFLVDRQSGRCSVCGVLLASLGDLQCDLDHVIPWRILGDPPTGHNWQLLCKPCNSGKGSFLTSAQSRESWNWAYGSDRERRAAAGAVDLPLRWVVLAERGACEAPGCSAVPADTELEVRYRDSSTGLAVADHLAVLCGFHSN